jgi:copper homeostasis protein
MVLEACVGNIGHAIRAENLGANRIELCENLSVGGTTPSAGTIKAAKKYLNIPVMVLIRPRGGNFVYSAEEIEVMKYDIELCKELGVDGVVIGALNPDHSINIDLTKLLIELARPMKITFHKAIDETPDPLGELRKLIPLELDHVLTSGGHENVKKGLKTLNEMCEIANGQMKILAAGNITKANLQKYQSLIHTDEFHGRLIVGPLV